MVEMLAPWMGMVALAFLAALTVALVKSNLEPTKGIAKRASGGLACQKLFGLLPGLLPPSLEF